MKKPKVKVTKAWIVEMLVDDNWEPTRAMGLDFAEAHEEARQISLRNPDDTFRVRRYTAAPTRARGRRK